jgi:hypothetical protein
MPAQSKDCQDRRLMTTQDLTCHRGWRIAAGSTHSNDLRRKIVLAFLLNPMRVWPPLLCAVLFFLSAPPARAGVPGLAVRLDYTRAAGAERCPDEHGVRDFLTGEFGYDPVQPDAGAGLRISITPVSRAFHVDIRLEDSSGNILWQEGFDEGDCAALIEQAALKAYIEVSTRLRPPPASPPPPPVNEAPSPEAPAAPAAPPAPSAPPVSPPRQPDPAPPVISSSQLRFVLGLQALVHAGITPTASAGGAASVELRLGALGIGLEGRVTHSVIPSEYKPRRETVSVHSLLGGGTLAPCYYYGPFAGCAVLDVGAVRFYARPDWPSSYQAIIAAGLRPGVRWSFSRRFALTGNVEISAILTKIHLIANHDDVWQSPAVFAAFGAGINADLTDLISRDRFAGK